MQTRIGIVIRPTSKCLFITSDVTFTAIARFSRASQSIGTIVSQLNAMCMYNAWVYQEMEFHVLSSILQRSIVHSYAPRRAKITIYTHPSSSYWYCPHMPWLRSDFACIHVSSSHCCRHMHSKRRIDEC